MKRQILLVPAIALAAACGGSGVQLQPGQWEMTVNFTDFEVPGAPPEMADQMKQAMSRPQVRSECITPEQARNPSGNMVANDSSNCQFSDSTFEGGVIRVAGTCQESGGPTATVSMEGSYTATTMEARISSEVRPAAGQAAPEGMPETIRMSGNFSGRRTGDCPG